MLERSASKTELVMRPAKSSLRAGYGVLFALLLGGPIMVGLVTSSLMARQHHSQGAYFLAIMTIFLCAMAWALTSVVNMSMSELELAAARLTIKTPFHEDEISTSESRATYDCGNYKYRHLLFETTTGYRLASSFLWWNAQFDQDVLGGFSGWCSAVSIPTPVKIDTLSFGLSAEQKKVQRALQRCLLRDWYIILAVVAGLAVSTFTIDRLIRHMGGI